MSGTSMSKKNTTNKNNFFVLAITRSLRNYWHVCAALTITILFGAIFAWINRNHINPDGTAYVQIARHYANLDFKEAINGYWSPLLSWLLIPFVLLGLSPQSAFHLLNFLLTISTVIGLLYFLNRENKPTTTDKFTQLLFLSSFAIMLSLWGHSVITPDLLSGVVLLLDIALLNQFLRKRNTKYAIALGAGLSSLYFTKAIGFYVGIALLLALIVYAHRDSRKLLWHTLLATGVFVTLSGAWVCSISFKYGHFTTSTAGPYNFAYIGPRQPSHAMRAEGYLPTHYLDSLSIWDDPSYYDMPDWSVTEHPKYYLNHVLDATRQAMTAFLGFGPLIILGLMTIFSRIRQGDLRLTAYMLALCAGLILAGYSLVLVEARYLWMVAIPVAAFCAVAIRQKSFDIRILNTVFIMAFILALTYLVTPLQKSYETQVDEGGIKAVSLAAKKYVPEYSPVAGTGNIYKFCYYATTRCVGNFRLTGDLNKDRSALNQMKKHNIQYYVRFSNFRVSYLQEVFRTASTPHRCYDYGTDKMRDCRRTYLTIYKVE